MAIIKAVMPSVVLAAFTFAPLSIRSWAISRWPFWQAIIKAVILLRSMASIAAPLSSKNLALSILFSSTACKRNVLPLGPLCFFKTPQRMGSLYNVLERVASCKASPKPSIARQVATCNNFS